MEILFKEGNFSSKIIPKFVSEIISRVDGIKELEISFPNLESFLTEDKHKEIKELTEIEKEPLDLARIQRSQQNQIQRRKHILSLKEEVSPIENLTLYFSAITGSGSRHSTSLIRTTNFAISLETRFLIMLMIHYHCTLKLSQKLNSRTIRMKLRVISF